MERGDSVLAGASLLFAVFAGFAGLVLLFASARLVGYFGIPGEPREHEWAAGVVVFGIATFGFFEAYRFYRFFANFEIRDRYYARSKSRQDERTKAKS